MSQEIQPGPPKLLVVCRDVLGNARDAAKLDYVPIAAPDVPITFILLAHLEDRGFGHHPLVEKRLRDNKLPPTWYLMQH